MYDKLTPDCLDIWQSSATVFQDYFIPYSINNAKAVGYYFEFDQTELHAAHADWVDRCKFWHENFMLPSTTALSHIKIIALLIHSLNKKKWVRCIQEFDQTIDQIEFDGTVDQREISRKDLNAGREAFIVLHFGLSVLNWFEKGRTDQIGDFQFRMTTDLKHDLLAYLVSKDTTEMAIFLTLKALYARNPKSAAIPAR